MDFNNQYQLLQEVYHGAKMGDIAIRLLLPKVDKPASAPTYRPNSASIRPLPPTRRTR